MLPEAQKHEAHFILFYSQCILPRYATVDLMLIGVSISTRYQKKNLECTMGVFHQRYHTHNFLFKSLFNLSLSLFFHSMKYLQQDACNSTVMSEFLQYSGESFK